MLSIKKWRYFMSLTIQKGFWQDSILASTRTKLAELYYRKPDIAKSEKRCLLEYWAAYEQLDSLLGEKWEVFRDWFTKATSPETITRCLRSLREDGTVKTTDKERQERREQQDGWCQHWGNQKRQEPELVCSPAGGDDLE
jgi:hypothetical protein